MRTLQIIWQRHKASETKMHRPRHTKWTFLKGISQFYPYRALFQTMENIFCQAPVYKHMNKNSKEDSTGCGCKHVQTQRIDHFIICVSKIM